MPLTGRFRFRRTLTGQVVLQVEDERPARWLFSRHQKCRRRWRDASYPELLRPELRGLVNLQDYVDGHPDANLAILGGRGALGQRSGGAGNGQQVVAAEHWSPAQDGRGRPSIAANGELRQTNG